MKEKNSITENMMIMSRRYSSEPGTPTSVRLYSFKQ